MQKYGKAIVAVLTAAIVAAYQALGGDGRIEADEWVAIAIAFATALGVFVVPLAQHARWTKSAVAALLAALQVLTTAMLDGFRADDVLLILITVAGALGVYVAPATSETPAGAPDIHVGVGADR